MTICANEKCKREVTRAKWVEGIGWLCMDCAPRAHVQRTNVFPFVTFGIGDKPGNVEVQSLRHLRKLGGTIWCTIRSLSTRILKILKMHQGGGNDGS